MMQVYLVGEANPYSDDPADALLPYPAGSAGARLRAILGVTEDYYLAHFQRRNLCRSTWNLRAARETAAYLASMKYARLVLLGAKVAAAFGLRFQLVQWHVGPLRLCDEPAGGVIRLCAVLPHPSGRSRAWHELGAVERARAAVASVRGPR